MINAINNNDINNNDINNNDSTKNGIITGGAVIDSGGFGCVFKPYIKCGKKRGMKALRDNMKENNNSNATLVSKVLQRKHAQREYQTAQTFEGILKSVPNYRSYYILPYTMCRPGYFSKNDLINVSKCQKLFKKINVTSFNINNEKDKLLTLQLPDAGKPIEKLIGKLKSKKDFNIFNSKMVRLIKYAVKPMNTKNIIHFDIKENNILYKKKNFQLIDWGISFIDTSEYDDNYNKTDDIDIPDNIKRRPISYNVPFSNIFSYADYKKPLNDLYRKNSNNNYTHILEGDALQTADYIIGDYSKKYKDSHIPGIMFISKYVFPNEDRLYLLRHFLANAMVEKFYSFHNNEPYFDMYRYYHTVLKHNIDIFGILMCYTRFFEKLSFPYHLQQQVKTKIIKMFKELIFRFSNEKVEIDYMIKKIKKLNFKNFKSSRIITKPSSSSKRSNKSRSSNKKKYTRKKRRN
jgi:hypothetical protein